MNWLSDLYQLISDGKRSDPCFWMDKKNEDELEKNKAITPILDFAFCLKTVEKQETFRKRKTMLLLLWNYYRVFKKDSMMFLNCFLSHFFIC